MKSWIKEDQRHKARIFQLVPFNIKEQSLSWTDKRDSPAYGPVWIFYETKIEGAWQKGIPVDNWKFFKGKLKLK